MLAALLLLPGPAPAADVPVSGRSLALRAPAARPARRRMRAVLRDASIAAPLPDPRLGARLTVSGGAAPGQCFAEIVLDPDRWRPLHGDGPGRGFRYRARKPGTEGVRAIVLEPGRIVVRARGGEWPCALGSSTQRLPFRVELETGGIRYCAAFGGSIRSNRAGHFLARGSPPPESCVPSDLTVASLNLLHGIFCSDGDSCRQTDRIDLFFQWLGAAGCPDVVTLQEIWTPMVAAIEERLARPCPLVHDCPFVYDMVYGRFNTIDDAMVLTRYPAVSSQVVPLHRGFRHVLQVRIDHPLGPVDVFTTHLASGSDGGDGPCGPDCPQECLDAGAVTLRDCQAVQLAELVETVHDVSPPAVVSGDLNAEPATFPYRQLADRGWSDTYAAAGGPECDPSTSTGCTAGREADLADLESTAVNLDSRIDYVFVVPPWARRCAIEPIGDPDGDGTATGIFAGDPNPFAACGPLPDPICWPSDHAGSRLDLDCN